MTVTIRPERPEDYPSVFQVNVAAFGQEDEARLVDALRADGYARVSLVAEVDRRVVGHILFSTLTLRAGGQYRDEVSLAPMAVVPEWQRQGIGTSLVHEGLSACEEAGHKVVVVVGHPDFYPRFGFSADQADRSLRSPYAGPACMALELVPGTLGDALWDVEYPPPFGPL